MDTGIIVALISVSGTLAGVVISNWYNSKNKKLSKLEDRVSDLEVEILSRQYEENIACDWIAELTQQSPKTIKIELRDKTEDKHGAIYRPRMTPADVK